MSLRTLCIDMIPLFCIKFRFSCLSVPANVFNLQHKISLLENQKVFDFSLKMRLKFIFILFLRCHALVPILFDSSNKLHRNIQYHPEQPARIDACVEALQKLDFVELQDVSETSSHAFSPGDLQHARSMLVHAHSEDIVSNFEKRCKNSKQRRVEEGKDPLGFVGYIDHDTFITTETFDVCLRATAAWIRAVDISLEDKIRTPTMALTRPPGHHATKLYPNGFCIFNFAAAAVIHVLLKHPYMKVSILDWDVHYGQGVADIIQHDPRVRYASIHQLDAFPYQGEKYQVSGENQNVMTIPIHADTTWACGYEQAFMEKALPFIHSEGTWEPDLVVVCAGFDALDSDELASVSLRASDFGIMTQMLRNYIPSTTGLMLGLEGGYQLSKFAGGGNLADAVVETVKACIMEKTK
jgi:acetoin utilization deacetylase AcuC-like enzyme